MAKLRKNFSFSFPLKHKVVRNLKIVTEHVGDLTVECTGWVNNWTSDLYDRYQVDIHFINWNGTDIKPVLEVTGGLEEIDEAAIRHFAGLCEEREVRA